MRSGELRKAGSRIRLQEQPLKILMVLLEQPGEVVTREDLKRRIWPDEPYGDFDHSVNVAIAKLRAALSDSAETPRYVETLPRRGYRFIFPVTPPPEKPETTDADPAAPAPAPALPEKRAKFRWMPIAAGFMLGAVLGGSAWWWIRSHKSKMLTDKDTLVLADFENTTGETVFDGTIRQALAVQLEQSPFLRLISDATVKQTLPLMGKPPDTRLTPDVAQQLCIRTGSAAVLNGSIAKLGNQYVLGLRVTNCRTSDSLFEEQVTADRKEEVLKALAQAAATVRKKLGESVGTVQKYNMPLEQVTTPSLEALHAYSLGRTTLIDREDAPGAIQLFERAIRLDPNFAMAYASLGLAYGDYSQEQSVWYYRKAYEMRDRVSDRERFYIEAHYHEAVTGDFEKARETYELWSRLYPRDDIPHLNLSELYSHFGQYEDARREVAESLRLLPGDCLSSAGLVGALVRLNRFDEARAEIKSAQQANGECLHFQSYRYALAFLNGNRQEMAQAVNDAGDKWQIQFLFLQAKTAAYDGRLNESHELMQRAASAARKSRQEQLGGYYEALGAELEAMVGDPEAAKKEAKEALAVSKVRDVESIAALVLALARDDRTAQSLADDLMKRFHESTLVEKDYVPCTLALLSLHRADAPKALEYLDATAEYELGEPDGNNGLLPVFLRGQAFLMSRRGREAAAEFQKILDHRGIVLNSPIGALAHLEIARAFSMQGNSATARAAYQDFLNLWKNADPDNPILRQAKAEYARLQ